MECPDCGSSYTIKYGRKQQKHGSVQQYYCNSCGRQFVDTELKGRSYPARVIIAALKQYYTGATLVEASNRVNQRFKVNTGRSTVHNWVQDYADVCRYSRVWQEYEQEYGRDLVNEHVFEHTGLEYVFKYHVAKLGEARQRFPALAAFVESVAEECPHDLFDAEEHRSSQLEFNVDASIRETRNNACELAELALTGVTDRRQRHEAVQEFMLACDRATVAVELPVWWYHKGEDTTITGHIDVVQTRANKVFILDYKPKAENKEPLSQLWSYARGLSYRTGIPFDRFRAAWFNENVYKEFTPSTATVSL